MRSKELTSEANGCGSAGEEEADCGAAQLCDQGRGQGWNQDHQNHPPSHIDAPEEGTLRQNRARCAMCAATSDGQPGSDAISFSKGQFAHKFGIRVVFAFVGSNKCALFESLCAGGEWCMMLSGLLELTFMLVEKAACKFWHSESVIAGALQEHKIKLTWCRRLFKSKFCSLKTDKALAALQHIKSLQNTS